MGKYISLAFLLVFLAGCGQKAATIPPPAVEASGIPMETVAEHGVADNCWLVINNNVYNLTDFVVSHPGGKAIIEGCGKDATQLFETRPMGSGTPHSDRARSILEKYYIGSLKK
jgi:cytochrome b involved in lipid metabolism